MNDYELKEKMAKKLNMSLVDTSKLLDATLDVIKEEFIRHGDVKLVNFGHFKTIPRKARKGYQAYYKRIIDIPAWLEPGFVAGKELKEIINEGYLPED